MSEEEYSVQTEKDNGAPAAVLRSRRRPSCLAVILVGLILFVVAFLVVAPVLSKRWAGTVHDRLAAEFGRPVEISGFAVGLPIRIDAMIVAGDGLIDTAPIFFLKGLTAWPDLAAFFSGRLALSSIEVDSAVISVRQGTDGTWSTKGLFPRPASGEPALKAILLPDLTVTIEMLSGTIRRTGSGEILLAADGAYDVGLVDPAGFIRVAHAAAGARGPRYRLEALADSIPLVKHPDPVRLDATYEPDSGEIGFRIATILRGESTAVSGEIRIDSRAILCDSGAWTWGRQSGRYKAGIEDRADERAYVDVMTPIRLAATDLNGLIERGSLLLERATLRGRVGGNWKAEAALSGEGIYFRREVTVENLGGSVRAEAGLDQFFRVQSLTARGKATFDRARLAEWIVERGDISFEASREQVTLSGVASLLDGSVRSRDLRIGLGPGFRPVSIKGRIAVKDLRLAGAGIEVEEVTLGKVTADLEIAAKRGEESAWNLDRVEGAVERLDLMYRGEAGELRSARLNLLHRGNKYDGVVSGTARFLGAEARGRATIERNQVTSVEVKTNNVPLAPIRRFFALEELDEILPHVKTAQFDGEATRTGEGGTTIVFKGNLGTDDFSFETGPTASRHQVRLRLDADYSSSDSLVTVREALVSIDGARTRLTLAPFSGTKNNFATRARLARLDIDHLKAAAIAWLPGRGLRNLKLSGGVSGWADLHRAGPEIGAEIDFNGNLLMQDENFDFNVKGRIDQKSPDLIVAINSVSLPALYETMADMDTRINRDLIRTKGRAGATMTIVGSDRTDSPWQDLNIEGMLSPRAAEIEFPEHAIRLSGVSGRIPFRLQGARLLEIPAPQSEAFSIDTVQYGGMIATELRGLIRFNEKNIIMDTTRFRFAEGRGHGAFAVDFPRWDEPRLASFGRIEGCSVGIVYRTMQPFKGILEGTGTATYEFKMDRGDLVDIKVDGRIANGILGAELLRGVVGELEPSPTKDVLSSLEEWHFKTSTLNFTFSRNYYDRQTAFNKFRQWGGGEDLYEVIGNIAIKGPARSENSPALEGNLLLHRLNPIGIFLNMLQLDLRIENMLTRLLMNRVGRRNP